MENIEVKVESGVKTLEIREGGCPSSSRTRQGQNRRCDRHPVQMVGKAGG